MSPAPQPAAMPRRCWYQFSLRTLLIGTAVVSAGLGSLVSAFIAPAQRQRAVVQMVERLGGKVDYADPPQNEWSVVRMLRNWLPRDYFDCLTHVNLLETAANDQDIARLLEVTQLRSLLLSRTQVTDAGLVHLKHFKRLEWLYLEGTQVTDAGLAEIAEMTQLKSLIVSDTQITDAGLVHLARLKQLRILSIAWTQIKGTEPGHLKQLTQLKCFWLHHTRMTPARVAELRQALPHCTVFN